jgi:transposase-like protein
VHKDVLKGKTEILTGPERRRRWSAEEKVRVVVEATMPGAQVAEIARRHGVSRSLIYTWRREAKCRLPGGAGSVALPELVPVVVSDVRQDEPTAMAGSEGQDARPSGVPRHEGVVDIMLPGDVRVRVRGRVEKRTLRAVLNVLRSA